MSPRILDFCSERGAHIDLVVAFWTQREGLISHHSGAFEKGRERTLLRTLGLLEQKKPCPFSMHG
jgi:hypothetical protein